jgi:rod shape-determining protein MreB
MIKQFIKMVHPRSVLTPSPRIIICVPCGSTQVERRAIRTRPKPPAPPPCT